MVLVKILKKKGLEDLAVDGRVITKWEDVDWIHMAQDRERSGLL
jgi:hypothetical protein